MSEMTIVVGSKNPNKKAAVERAFSGFSRFAGVSFGAVAADSMVSDQPVGYAETLLGADNRAKDAFFDGGLSVGLESGLIPVAGTETGYMNLTACTIYDGTRCYRGTGPAFELPADVCRMVVEEGLELDEAVNRAGLSVNKRIGYAEGLIGILSGGAVTRADYMVPAVTMALVSFTAAQAKTSHA